MKDRELSSREENYSPTQKGRFHESFLLKETDDLQYASKPVPPQQQLTDVEDHWPVGTTFLNIQR